MRAVAAAAPVLEGEAARRAEAALARRKPAAPIDLAASRAEFCAARRATSGSPRGGRHERRRAELRDRAWPRPAAGEPALVVDVEGFEGPLDLLLTLARQQKVDLAKISILALADQYLAFIEAARKLRLELAADYLVMAAWLAYLKSRLLLPEQPAPDGLSAEDMANALAQRLRRLEDDPPGRRAIDATGRSSAARFFSAASRNRSPRSSGRNGRQRSTICFRPMRRGGRTKRGPMCSVPKRTVWSLAEAREAIERLVGRSFDWSPLDQYLHGISGRAVAAADGAGLKLCGDAGIGARRPARSASACGVCAAFRARPAQRSRQNCRKAAAPDARNG